MGGEACLAPLLPSLRKDHLIALGKTTKQMPPSKRMKMAASTEREEEEEITQTKPKKRMGAGGECEQSPGFRGEGRMGRMVPIVLRTYKLPQNREFGISDHLNCLFVRKDTNLLRFQGRSPPPDPSTFPTRVLFLRQIKSYPQKTKFQIRNTNPFLALGRKRTFLFRTSQKFGEGGVGKGYLYKFIRN